MNIQCQQTQAAINNTIPVVDVEPKVAGGLWFSTPVAQNASASSPGNSPSQASNPETSLCMYQPQHVAVAVAVATHALRYAHKNSQITTTDSLMRRVGERTRGCNARWAAIADTAPQPTE